MRTQTEGFELDGQAVGEGGLAGGAGSRDQDEADAALVVDLLGDLTDAALLQGLLDQDHVADAAGADLLVQVADRADVDQVAPLGREHKLLEQTGLVNEFLQLEGLVCRGQDQDQAALVGLQAEPAHVAGRGEHIAVEIVGVAVHPVDVDRGTAAVVEEFLLVLHALPAEELDRIVDRIGLLDDGNVLFHDQPHPLLELARQLRCRADPAQYAAEAGISK